MEIENTFEFIYLCDPKPKASSTESVTAFVMPCWIPCWIRGGKLGIPPPHSRKKLYQEINFK
ncbi:hypothetical protein BLA29_001148 [Euroglyphus maynei]|uniref:Uncharacterized protein n=1 Tax=Euroglyphus maynei TaxID=6958 RepID=A0A1Y3BG14_EURMA|nr:hypothetical protein BLA29_001148 [Euroglyphus maynei]